MKISILKVIMSGFAVLWWCCGCFKSTGLNLRDLVGSYRANYPNVKAILMLNPDGTYKQQITLENNKIRYASGKWSYDKKSGYVDVDNAMWLQEIPGKKNPFIQNTGFIAYVEGASPQDIMILLNNDLNYFYDKVK